jgi:DNA-directed RNA polymerase subunit RPC12/RpoP
MPGKSGRRPWGEGGFSVGQLPLIVDAAPVWYSARLPRSYYEPDTIADLAPDAQLYFRCTACGRHWRVSPSLRLGPACPCSPGRELTPVKARPRLGYLCLDCKNEYVDFVNPWDRPGRCPRCLSRKYLVHSAKRVEPRPEVVFGRTPGTPLHRWAVDVAADLDALHAEQELIAELPEAELHLVPLALFTARLRELTTGALDKVSLLNCEAHFLHESYKLTTDITTGWTALRLYWEAADQTRGLPAMEAPIVHNVAMAAYSLLSIAQGPVLAGTENGDLLRDIGRSAADRALELYPTEPDRIRVLHLLGDLCATGEDTLAEARSYYDAVLAVRNVPDHIRAAATAGRMRVDASLGAGTR